MYLGLRRSAVRRAWCGLSGAAALAVIVLLLARVLAGPGRAAWSQGANSYVYGSGSASRLTQYRLEPGGALDPAPVTRGRPGSGVVWTVDQTHGATLRAFAADDVARQLWSSAGDPAGNGLEPGEFDHFTVPSTAGGLVFVGDQGHLEVYGILQG